MIAFMWFMWNKTTFGKNMFAVGSNPGSSKRIWCKCILDNNRSTYSGWMHVWYYRFHRVSTYPVPTANTGLNYECVLPQPALIGGVSFVGGTGKISGIVLGVFILRIIFVALQFLSINQSMQYIIKGLIILVACSIDMRKYLVRK